MTWRSSTYSMVGTVEGRVVELTPVFRDDITRVHVRISIDPLPDGQWQALFGRVSATGDGYHVDTVQAGYNRGAGTVHRECTREEKTLMIDVCDEVHAQLHVPTLVNTLTWARAGQARERAEHAHAHAQAALEQTAGALHVARAAHARASAVPLAHQDLLQSLNLLD